jgi:hypothetical protein
VLEYFGSNPSKLLSETGIFIVEHYHKNELPKEIGELTCTRLLKQGDATLSFYELANPLVA